MNRIELVLQALRIHVVDTKGRRAWARCPFHDDHEPSWFIRISGKRFGQNHCFSCKKGGTLTELVMHVRACGIRQAKKFIEEAGKGYEPPRASVRVVRQPPILGRRRFKLPKEIEYGPMANWVDQAREYAESRGITEDEVERYRIGYVSYGRLIGRIVIPWLGEGGLVGGYSARSFIGDEPKYLTPDEKENPDRGIMVGEHLWPPPHKRTTETVVVTEGALNALAAERVLPGCYVAALGGSDVDPVHVVKLATFPRVVILTDSDPAGDVAADKLLKSLGRYIEAIRVRLPDGKDALDVGPKRLQKMLTRGLRKLPSRHNVS